MLSPGSSDGLMSGFPDVTPKLPAPGLHACRCQPLLSTSCPVGWSLTESLSLRPQVSTDSLVWAWPVRLSLQQGPVWGMCLRNASVLPTALPCLCALLRGSFFSQWPLLASHQHLFPCNIWSVPFIPIGSETTKDSLILL